MTTFHNEPIKINGTLPSVGKDAPDFKLVANDLSEKSLAYFAGKRKVLNIFPSVDTDVCATSVRRFNQEASSLANTVVLCISADLPFAQKRFCAAEGLANVINLSCFRAPQFKENYGVDMVSGPIAGLCARAVVVLDEYNQVLYSELAEEVTDHVHYDQALAVLKR